MRLKSYVKNIPEVKEMLYRVKILKQHRQEEIKHISDFKKTIYYIIRFADVQSCGWTVWERVVLFGCIYAEDNGMIPVIDMQTKKNIYLENSEVGSVNAWDKFYLQPSGVTYDEAIKSNNYVLGDPTQEWFVYLRLRKSRRNKTDYLRKKYNQYIKLRSSVSDELEKRYQDLLNDHKINLDSELVGICIRGTDYVQFHHSVQPFDLIMEDAKRIKKQHSSACFYVATEDSDLYEKILNALPNEKIISYKAGGISKSDINDLIGKKIREKQSAYEAAMDYLTVLFLLNKCQYLIGGVCGATIVAEYRRNPPYKYINIIDTNEHY
jgi:CRISPR/Cas system endoribonuclease Cas6 (RAMP superfamily)